jgi:hypothetical protein
MEDPTNTTTTILDHIDNIVIPGNVFAEPVNEYWALLWLRQGMEYLYHQVRQCDEAARQQVNPNGNVRFAGSGNFPAFQQIPQGLLTCAFHWYAISACQYVGTVGAVAYTHDSNRPEARGYLKIVIPEVLAFRDKVAAHFAWWVGDNRDNPAERFASIIPPLVFQEDSFQVGALAVYLRKGGQSSNSKTIQPWSLSRVHERLRKRYWPDLESPKETTGETEAPTSPGKMGSGKAPVKTGME